MPKCKVLFANSDLRPAIRELGAIILVDKPEGLLSMDVVRAIKGITGRKCGHGGTLDPFASGLMIIATGKCTRELANYINLDKKYEGKIALGIETDTLDPYGTIINVNIPPQLNETEIIEAMKRMVGEHKQTPPLFSAVKIGGKRAYELARQGIKEIQLPERTVLIYSFQPLSITLEKVSLNNRNFIVPVISFHIHCSKGTYVRVVAQNLGRELGYPAMLISLRRTSIGQWNVNEAWQLSHLIECLKGIVGGRGGQPPHPFNETKTYKPN